MKKLLFAKRFLFRPNRAIFVAVFRLFFLCWCFRAFCLLPHDIALGLIWGFLQMYHRNWCYAAFVSAFAVTQTNKMFAFIGTKIWKESVERLQRERKNENEEREREKQNEKRCCCHSQWMRMNVNENFLVKITIWYMIKLSQWEHEHCSLNKKLQNLLVYGSCVLFRKLPNCSSCELLAVSYALYSYVFAAFFKHFQVEWGKVENPSSSTV